MLNVNPEQFAELHRRKRHRITITPDRTHDDSGDLSEHVATQKRRAIMHIRKLVARLIAESGFIPDKSISPEKVVHYFDQEVNEVEKKLLQNRSSVLEAFEVFDLLVKHELVVFEDKDGGRILDMDVPVGLCQKTVNQTKDDFLRLATINELLAQCDAGVPFSKGSLEVLECQFQLSEQQRFILCNQIEDLDRWTPLCESGAVIEFVQRIVQYSVTGSTLVDLFPAKRGLKPCPLGQQNTQKNHGCLKANQI